MRTSRYAELLILLILIWFRQGPSSPSTKNDITVFVKRNTHFFSPLVKLYDGLIRVIYCLYTVLDQKWERIIHISKRDLSLDSFSHESGDRWRMHWPTDKQTGPIYIPLPADSYGMEWLFISFHKDCTSEIPWIPTSLVINIWGASLRVNDLGLVRMIFSCKKIKIKSQHEPCPYSNLLQHLSCLMVILPDT